jgi:HEAT repeat protein
LHNILSIFLQIDWSDLSYTVDDLGRTVNSFPVHIRILLAITLVFLMIILVLLAVILGSRIYKTGRLVKREDLRQKYQQIFRELLFGDSISGPGIKDAFDQKDLNDKFLREIIREEIIHLHENFTGETAERLEEIYMRLNFHFDSIKKLKSKKWYVVAKGMRELALMNIRQALSDVQVFLNDKNEILRMESRIAIMKLSDSDPLDFLTHETAPLTGWDTANIYSMLSKMPENMIPDFSKWLSSTNTDVVLFCIQMIGSFRQQESVNKLLVLLKSDDERIRMAVVKALRFLNVAAGEQPIVDIYSKENLSVRTEILRTLEVVGTPFSIPFLEKIIRGPIEDYPLVIQAVRSLMAMGENGKQSINRIFDQSPGSLQLIINHAKDKRL